MINQVCDFTLLEQNPNYDLTSPHYGDWNEYSEELNFSCNYINESEAALLLSRNNNNSDLFSVFNLNIQSLHSKYNDLISCLSTFETKNALPDIIALQELWTSPSTNFGIYNIPGYKWIHKSRTEKGGGGVGFLIKNKIKTTEILHNYHYEGIIETICIKASCNNFKYQIINIYRPPHKNPDELRLFFTTFSELIDRISDSNLPTFVIGDLNINAFECTNSTSNASHLLDIMIYNGFVNSTLKATRITDSSYSLIDFFFTKNYIQNIYKSLVLVSDISDHFLTITSFKTKIKTKFKKEKNFQKRLVDNERLQSLSNALMIQDWSLVKSSDDVNEAYALFLNIFLDLYDFHCPVKTFKNNHKTVPQQPYVNQHLLNCRAFKNYLYSIQKTHPTPENINRFKIYRNELRRSFRRAKNEYFKKEIREAGRDGKKIWSILRMAMGINKIREETDFLNINGEKIEGEQEISEHFNDYFSNLGTNLREEIPKTRIDFRYFLPERSIDEIVIPPLTELKTFHLITSAPPKNSTDSDDISMKTLIHCAGPLSVPLCYLYNLSLSSGKYPEKMKISKCIVLFKGGDINSPDCFRCVSLISNLSKPYEKYLYSCIYDFLENKNFFSLFQFGFRKSISTAHNILNLSNIITETLANNEVCCALLIDIKKCFDLVDRRILFEKLNHYGIRGLTLQLLISYFENRKQKVFFKGRYSNLREIIIGILQGSCLGPLLFLIFINDLDKATALALSQLFADDNILIAKSHNITSLINKLQEIIPLIVSWYSANNLIINGKKTKVLLFTSPRHNFTPEEIELRVNLPVYINTNHFDENLPEKITKLSLISNENENKENRYAKHLGCLLDEKLKFKYHFDNLHKRLQKAIFSLKIMKHILDKQHLRILYNAYCKSILDYSCFVFTAVTRETINPILILQKQCVRIIAKSNNSLAHTLPLFKQLQILPFKDMVTYNACLFMYQIKNKTAPKVFHTTWQYNIDIHRYPTRNNENFRTLTHQHTYIMNSPLYKFPRLFNNLPNHIKNLPSEKVFKKRLFLHMINNLE